MVYIYEIRYLQFHIFDWDLGPGTWDLGPGTWDLGPKLDLSPRQNHQPIIVEKPVFDKPLRMVR